MKSQNRKYFWMLAGILLFFGVFLTSKSWMPDARTVASQNYDQVVTLGSWQLKVTDAVYDPETKILTFSLYERASGEGLSEPSLSIYNGIKRDTKQPLKYVAQAFQTAQTGTDGAILSGRTITIYDVPKSYWYVSVNLEVEGAKTVTKSTDIFGQEITESGGETANETQTAVIQIDYRKASQKGA